MPTNDRGMSTARRVAESLWVLVPLMTCGLLGFVGFAYAWARTRSPRFRRATVIGAVTTAVAWLVAFTWTEPDVVAADGTRTPGQLTDGAVGVVIALSFALVAYGAALLPAYLRALGAPRTPLPAPTPPPTPPGSTSLPTVEGTLARLDDLARQVASGPALPADVRAAVERILARLRTALEHAQRGVTTGQQLDVVHRIVTDYLPTSLNAYVALPTGYATTTRGRSGRTPRDELLHQLGLLDVRAAEVADAALAGDVARLEAQGRFLEDRFARSELDLP